ncbi:unnamed protein product, partial [Phaeothamnion confervicola]
PWRAAVRAGAGAAPLAGGTAGVPVQALQRGSRGAGPANPAGAPGGEPRALAGALRRFPRHVPRHGRRLQPLLAPRPVGGWALAEHAAG